jgi:hypothetical protein
MATTPSFAVTPRIGLVQVTAANTARDGTGTIATVLTGVASGTKVNEVVIHATVTTTAGMVRLFLHDGTNARLFDEIPIAAVTVSSTNPAVRHSRTYGNLVLPSTSWSLRASTEKAEVMNVMAFAADL